MIYYIKENKKLLKMLSVLINMKSVLFLSKVLILAEFCYWSIELEMTDIIWVIKKLKIMILNFKHKIIIFINYEVNSDIIH